MSTPVTTTKPRSRATGEARRDLRRAWLALAVWPLSVVVATQLGDWLLALQGYEPDGDEYIPFGAALFAGAPGVAVLLVPNAAAFFLGMRARHRGRSAGLMPAIVGAVTAAVVIVFNTAALFSGR
ncbi:MAG: hypothetical protein ACRDPQ_10555 [Nocardioidaceae bacterium]